MCKYAVKPFVKWAGGKSQLLNEISAKYPPAINSYCEPFVGGGAVLFDILSHRSPSEVLINDINAELINTYSQIQKNVKAVINELDVLQKLYWGLSEDDRNILFNQKRQIFNDYKIGKTESADFEKAVLFIFLNKTCFNGLYRVNRQGLFNVSKGYYKKPPICDADNLTELSRLLLNVRIKSGDYKDCADYINRDTFVFIDPPYRPLNKTASFTGYTENGFDDTRQIELKGFIDDISRKGALVLASNSDPRNTDESDSFFDDLYSGYNIQRVTAKRMINSKGSGRGDISELLISNY